MIRPLIVIILIIILIFFVVWYNKKERFISLTSQYSFLYDDDDEDDTNHHHTASSIVNDTVAEDVLDHIDCNRVKRIKYQSPVNSECDSNYSSQQYGSPALKYPVLIPI